MGQSQEAGKHGTSARDFAKSNVTLSLIAVKYVQPATVRLHGGKNGQTIGIMWFIVQSGVVRKMLQAKGYQLSER